MYYTDVEKKKLLKQSKEIWKCAHISKENNEGLRLFKNLRIVLNNQRNSYELVIRNSKS